MTTEWSPTFDLSLFTTHKANFRYTEIPTIFLNKRSLAITQWASHSPMHRPPQC